MRARGYAKGNRTGRLGRYCAFHFDETLIAGKDTPDVKTSAARIVFSHTGHLVI